MEAGSINSPGGYFWFLWMLGACPGPVPGRALPLMTFWHNVVLCGPCWGPCEAGKLSCCCPLHVRIVTPNGFSRPAPGEWQWRLIRPKTTYSSFISGPLRTLHCLTLLLKVKKHGFYLQEASIGTLLLQAAYLRVRERIF